MKKHAKKDAGFDGNRNQRQGGQVVQPHNTNEYTTAVHKLQGQIPWHFVAQEGHPKDTEQKLVLLDGYDKPYVMVSMRYHYVNEYGQARIRWTVCDDECVIAWASLDEIYTPGL